MARPAQRNRPPCEDGRRSLMAVPTPPAPALFRVEINRDAPIIERNPARHHGCQYGSSRQRSSDGRLRGPRWLVGGLLGGAVLRTRVLRPTNARLTCPSSCRG